MSAVRVGPQGACGVDAILWMLLAGTTLVLGSVAGALRPVRRPNPFWI